MQSDRIESRTETPARDVVVAKSRRWGRWAAAALVLMVLILLIKGLADNENIEWEVVGHYLFNVNILEGLRTTLLLALVSEVFALLLGVVVGFGRLSKNPVLGIASAAFVWFFRSVPILVLILLAGNFALFAPTLGIGIPFTSVTFVSGDTNDVLSLFVAAVIALVLHDAAYNGEIVRSGVISVDAGQAEACSALGMTWWQTQKKVLLPQALRVMVPPAASQFVTLLKATALVSVIGVQDLLTSAELISSNNQRTVELLIVATIWYLLVTSLAMVGQIILERRLSRSRTRSSEPTAVKVMA